MRGEGTPNEQAKIDDADATLPGVAPSRMIRCGRHRATVAAVLRDVDAFGLFDLIAVRADVRGVVGVQATSGTNHASRVRKLRGNATLLTWLAAGNRAEVWSWTKRRWRWACRRQRLDLASITATEESEVSK